MIAGVTSQKYFTTYNDLSELGSRKIFHSQLHHNVQCQSIRRGFCLLAPVKPVVYLHRSSRIIFTFHLKISKVILDMSPLEQCKSHF